jgi:hypothetical protein
MVSGHGSSTLLNSPLVDGLSCWFVYLISESLREYHKAE